MDNQLKRLMSNVYQKYIGDKRLNALKEQFWS